MKPCIKCGTPINDNAKFCETCGAVQEAPQPQYAQSQYTQPQYEMSGTPVAGGQPKKKFPIWIIPVAVAVIAAIVVLIIFMVKKKDGDNGNSGEGGAPAVTQGAMQTDTDEVTENSDEDDNTNTTSYDSKDDDRNTISPYALSGVIEDYFNAFVYRDVEQLIGATCSEDMFQAMAIAYGIDEYELMEILEEAVNSYDDIMGFFAKDVYIIECFDDEKVNDEIMKIAEATGVNVEIQAMCQAEVELSWWDEDSQCWVSSREDYEFYKVREKWYFYLGI